MSDLSAKTIINDTGGWAAVRWPGELASFDTYKALSDYLSDLPEHAASSAKIFQGTDEGVIATYLVHKQ